MRIDRGRIGECVCQFRAVLQLAGDAFQFVGHPDVVLVRQGNDISTAEGNGLFKVPDNAQATLIDLDSMSNGAWRANSCNTATVSSDDWSSQQINSSGRRVCAAMLTDCATT